MNLARADVVADFPPGSALDLGPDEWEVVLCEDRERTVTASDGSLTTPVDAVVLLRRL